MFYLELIGGIVARVAVFILLFLLVNFLITEYAKVSRANTKFKQEMNALEREYLELQIQKLKAACGPEERL